MGKVCQELGLSYKQMRKQVVRNGKARAKFMELSIEQLGIGAKMEKKQSRGVALAALCEIVIERVDGNRLSLNMPLESCVIAAICSNFLRQ
jgi:hypothetical protein